jgi:hypothetical protein
VVLHAEEIFDNMELIEFLRDKLYLIYTWGSHLRDLKNREFLKNSKVFHGVCYDRIRETSN